MLERRQLGHYLLIRRIGGGGMGEIYLAQDTRIERQVALKIMRAEADPYPDAAATADAQRLFLREMQAITRLDHPRILPLYDFGEERDGNHVITYMVMPYRPEGSLSDWLQRRGTATRLSFQDVAYFVAQAAEALQHAHDHELVHQDVKPSNFLVRDHPGYPLPDLLLSDFGIARVLSATSTASQNVRGTPTSMAPEQWESKPVPATDQYALAIMAYVLLTGRPPFSGRMEQLLLQHLSVPPQPPSALHDAIPRDLDTVILTALAKKPGERFGSISAFARAFQQASAVSGFALSPTVNPVAPISQPGEAAPLPVPPAYPPPIMPVMQYPMPAEAAPPVSAYPVANSSSQLLPTVPPASTYPQTGDVAPLPPTIAPAAATPFPFSPPQQAVVLPSMQSSPAYPSMPGQPSMQSSPAYPPLPGQPSAQYPPYQYSNTTAQHQIVGPAPEQPGRPARPTKLLRLLIAAGLAALLIVGGIIGVGVYQNHVASLNAASTASAQSTRAAQGTALAQATLDVQATSTAIASQATADAQATVNAQASATAQVVASNPYPSYMSGSGTLVLLDSLQAPGVWSEQSDTGFGGNCQFTSGSYHISQTQPARFYECTDNHATFDNFALEVQMTIVQGDCGGVTIRATGAKMYYFRVCSDNTYGIWKYVDTNGGDAISLASGNLSLNGGANTLGIQANGASVTLYLNQQNIDSINDGSYTSGYLSLTAGDITNSTEVAYSNIRIWE